MNKKYILIGICIIFILYTTNNVLGAYTLKDSYSNGLDGDQTGCNPASDQGEGLKFTVTSNYTITRIDLPLFRTNTAFDWTNANLSVYIDGGAQIGNVKRSISGLPITKTNITFNFTGFNVTTGVNYRWVFFPDTTSGNCANNIAITYRDSQSPYVAYGYSSSYTSGTKGTNRATEYYIYSGSDIVTNTISLNITTPLNNTYSKFNTVFLTGNISSITGVWNVSAIFNGTNVGSAYTNIYNYDNFMSGLVSVYTMNNFSGTNSIDGKTNLTLTGALTNVTSCINGGCLNATSTSSYLYSNSYSDIGGATNNWSISWWMNIRNYDQYDNPLSIDGTGTNISFCEFDLQAADGRFECKGSSDYTLTKPVSPFYNSWHHFVYRSNNTNTALYIDGTLNSTATKGMTLSTGKLYLFTYSGATTRVINGMMDEVYIFNRTISDKEISQLANSSNPGLAFYPFSSLTNINNTNISTTGVFNITTSALAWNVEYPWYFQAQDLSSNTTVNTSTQYLVAFNSTPTATASCVVNLGNAYFIPNGCTSTY